MTIYKLPVNEDELIELVNVFSKRQDTRLRYGIYKKSLLLLEVAKTERESIEARKAFDNLVGYESDEDDLYIPEHDSVDETGAEDV